MDQNVKIKSVVLLKSSIDGSVKFKIIFAENPEKQTRLIPSLEEAKEFIKGTLLPSKLDWFVFAKKLKTAYQYVLEGGSTMQVIDLWSENVKPSIAAKFLVNSSKQTNNSRNKINYNNKSDVQQNKSFKSGDIIIHKFKDGDDLRTIDTALERIRKDFPGVLPDQADANWLISKVFPSKIKQRCVIRNQAYWLEKEDESFVVPRADIYCINNPSFFSMLDENQRILFSGNIKSGEFLVDDIRVISNPIIRSEDKEIDATFYIGSDGNGKTNCLKAFTINPTKGREFRSNEIQEWDRYLDWKNELAKLRIQALKYIGFCFDLSEEKMSFLVAFSDYSKFDDFKKYLRRDDTSIFSNQYSLNRFVFQLNKSDKVDTSVDYDSGIHLEFISVGKPFPADALIEDKWVSSRNFAKRYSKVGTYEEIPDLSINSLIDGIENETGKVMLAEVKFSLSDNATEWIHKEIRKNGMLPDDAERRLASEFFSDGFIATSQIGDFALIRRLKRGIADYVSGNMSSQGLAEWLFDIKKARPITEPFHIKKWQNKKLNDKQKQAVEKILAAPDVCLIQGPPGTGKTTVIAEAIYQFVVQHKRVLVASQANLAVDNALERLIANPKIRAIRLGNERKFDASVSNITERNVLQNFYSTLIDYMDKEYLDKWDESERILHEIEEDFELADKTNSEIESFSIKKREVESSIEKISNGFDFNGTKEIIKKYEEDQLRLKTLVDYCIGKTESFEFPASDAYFEEVLKEVDFNLQSLNGSHLVLSSNILSASTRRLFCQDVIKSAVLASKLLEKLKSSDNNVALANLKAKEETLLAKMESDISLVSEWQTVRNKIKQIAETMTVVRLDADEEALFDISIARISKPEIKNAKILNILEDVKLDIEGILNTAIQTARRICQEFDQRLNHLRERIRSFEEETAQFSESLEKYETVIAENQVQLDELCKKYESNRDELHDSLQQRKNDLQTRLYSMARKEDWASVFVGFKEWVRNIPDYNSERNLYLDSYINGCNVVGVSCTESSRTLLNKGFKDFDVVIIDEVSKATPPELLLPMLKGQKIVLVGDHRQLPPLFNEHENSYQEIAAMQSEFDDVALPLTMEDFEKYKGMVTSSLFQQYFESADPSIKETLTYQYRMHGNIMNIVNTFYDGFLEDGNVKDKTGDEKSHNISIDSVIGSDLIVPEKHAYWIDSSELYGQRIDEQREIGSTSFLNTVEAYAIRELLRKMEIQYSNDKSRNNRPVSVGVISFYALQVALLRKLIQKESFHAIDVEVNTVDRFQGKEKEVILVSLVRNKEHARHNTDSFIAAFQRINVAFSRAQNLLVILGAKNMYADQPVVITDMNDGKENTIMAYRDIIGELNMNGAFFSVDDLIPEQTAIEILAEYKKQAGGSQI